MKIHPSGRAGFTLTEVMIVAGILGLLAEIAVPNFLTAKQNANRNACINNLRMIDNAKTMWALESLRPASAVPALTDIEPYIYHGADASDKLYCPRDQSHLYINSYDPGDLLTPPVCLREPTHILE